VAAPTIAAMETMAQEAVLEGALGRASRLTPMQERTLHSLIGSGRLPDYDRGLQQQLLSRLEEGLEVAGVRQGQEPLWLGKHRLGDAQRCEGLFDAGLLGEGDRFEHSERTAAGSLFHAAIEVDVATERRFDPRSVSERAASNRSQADASFARFWSSLDEFGRAALIAEAGRHLSLFRDSFPPLVRRWAPQTELPMRVRLIGGAVVLSGTPDLQLGRIRRLAIDFKSGRAWPEHPEDMRFYALLLLLRTGVAPYRVATFFLDWRVAVRGRNRANGQARSRPGHPGSPGCRRASPPPGADLVAGRALRVVHTGDVVPREPRSRRAACRSWVDP
jgi:hypothetical protein